MAGFPLAAIGAGLGQFANYLSQKQAQDRQQQMLALTLARYQQEQTDRQRQRQTEAAEFQSLAAGAGGDTGISPVGGGSLPYATPMPKAEPPPQPMAGGGGSGSYWTPAGLKALQPTEGRYDQIHYPSGRTTSGVKSSASGAYGFLDGTWREFAPKAGVDLNQYPRAYMAPPEVQDKVAAITPVTHWTGVDKSGKPFNSAAQRIAANPAYVTGGGASAGAGGPLQPTEEEIYQAHLRGEPTPGIGAANEGEIYQDAPRGQQMAQAGGQTATDAVPTIGAAPTDPAALKASQQLTQMIPPAVHGKMSRDALVREIAKIPGLDDGQRAQVFMHRWKDMAPQEQEYTREYMQQRGFEAQDARAARRETAQDARTAEREVAKDARETAREKAKWGEPVKMEGEDGKPQWVQVNKGTGEVRPVKGLTGDVTKMGSTAAAKPADPKEVAYWTKVLQAGGALPPGLARTKSGSMVVQEIMKNMAAGDQSPGDFIAQHASVKANTTSLTNMTKMSDAAISFEKLAEKNFDVALKLAPDAVPTELGPFFNRWVEEGEAALGDPSVPPYVAAMITGANEYAKVMSGSTGTAASTVDARKEARDLFSPYMSLPQISQVIAVAKADMKNRENTLNEQVGLIKQRLGSTAPTPTAPPATPRATGQESQNEPPTAAVPAQDAVPVPPGLAADPDGTSYEKDGAMWVKRGNQLVKTPGAVRTQ